MQAASEKVTNGKVKGLFCCLSTAQFYRLACFGLFSQTLPTAPGRKKSDASSAAPQTVQEIASELFSTAWFCSTPPLGVALSPAMAHVNKVSGTALRLATAPSAEDGTEDVVRFSRYSTISRLRDFSEAELEQGVFLSLCRVLIVHQRTVDTPIAQADIVEAMALNYDALYSSVT